MNITQLCRDSEYETQHCERKSCCFEYLFHCDVEKHSVLWRENIFVTITLKITLNNVLLISFFQNYKTTHFHLHTPHNVSCYENIHFPDRASVIPISKHSHYLLIVNYSGPMQIAVNLQSLLSILNTF